MTHSDTYASAFHTPVLVHEVVELLGNADHVLDCTLGGGGHALALLERGARVTGLDRDPEAVRAASARLASYAGTGQFRAAQGSFGDLNATAIADDERFAGILLDLGVSSHQMDSPARGFTFRTDAPLDMRMTVDTPDDAARLVNESSERELAAIFRDYGDVTKAGRLAREIVRRRGRRPFRISDDLVDAIRAVLGPRSGPAEFAPVFQALRVAVNDELGALERALPVLRDRLSAGGTMAAITYHSGEDRLVKRAFRDWSAACVCPPRQPVCTCRGRPLGRSLTRRPMLPSDAESASNPRARSAHLRAWQSAA